MGKKVPSSIYKLLLFCLSLSLIAAHGKGISQSAGDVAFAVSSLAVGENATSVELSVKLVEAKNTPLKVDVVFREDSSSADAFDIGFTSPTSVSFHKADNSGAIRTVTISINNDLNFEDDEIAVFQLKNNTGGAIPGKNELQLTITDSLDKSPSPVIINEIFAAPPASRGGDANGDGSTSAEDEFVEIVSKASKDINISGWQLSADGGKTIMYTFPPGTVLPGGHAIVIFGGGKPAGNFGGAIVQSSSGLGLSNNGGTLNLLDDQGNTIVDLKYSNAGEEGESLNRESDTSMVNFVKHSSARGSNGAAFSPGTKVDGTTWGNGTYARSIRHSEGWRFVSVPSRSITFDDLFKNVWTQGAAGSDAPSARANIFYWQEPGGGTFSPVTNMSDALEAGRGYLTYIFEDDDFRAGGVQGGFPKIIHTNKNENSGTVSIPVSSSDENDNGAIDNNEGFNLLGNPFGADISVAEIIDALEAVNANVNTNVLVWDYDAGNGNGAYIDLSAGDRIEPFQAFFVRYMTAGVSGNVSFDKSKLAADQKAPIQKRMDENKSVITLSLGDGEKFDSYKIEFRENAAIGKDRWDAPKLFSLNANSINLFSTVGKEIKLTKNMLPPIESLEGELRIPLGYEVPSSGQYIFSWSEIDKVPKRFELYLIDNKNDKRVNLRRSERLTFNALASTSTANKEKNRKQLSPNITGKNKNGSGRFELSIVSASNDADSETSGKPISISQNYPNPFRSQTTIDLKLEKKMQVKVTIWNIVGQKITTIRDQTMEAGKHPLVWNITSNMPSGIYICKVEAGGNVLTRKMTLVK